MQGVLTGFTVIATVIAVGYVLGRRGYLGQDGRAVLTRLAFNVATPALLFTMLADADLSVVLSTRLLVTATAVAATAGVFVVVAGLFLRWEAGRVTIGALCSSYVNAGNLGIPIAVYVLGDASLVAPVLLLQQILVTLLALTVLDLGLPGEPMSLVRRLTTPCATRWRSHRWPHVTVAASGRTLPGPLLEPLALIGDMSVPAVLIAFGISLHGGERPGRGEDRGALYLSAALKTVAQPTVAWAVGSRPVRTAGRGAAGRRRDRGAPGRPEPLHVRLALPGRRAVRQGVHPAVHAALGPGADRRRRTARPVATGPDGPGEGVTQTTPR